MSKTFTDVEVFLAACGQSHASTPVPRNELSALYKKLIDEEYQEFLDAYEDLDNVEQLDACFVDSFQVKQELFFLCDANFFSFFGKTI